MTCSDPVYLGFSPSCEVERKRHQLCMQKEMPLKFEMPEIKKY